MKKEGGFEEKWELDRDGVERDDGEEDRGRFGGNTAELSCDVRVDEEEIESNLLKLKDHRDVVEDYEHLIEFYESSSENNSVESLIKIQESLSNIKEETQYSSSLSKDQTLLKKTNELHIIISLLLEKIQKILNVKSKEATTFKDEDKCGSNLRNEQGRGLRQREFQLKVWEQEEEISNGVYVNHIRKKRPFNLQGKMDIWFDNVQDLNSLKKIKKIKLPKLVAALIYHFPKQKKSLKLFLQNSFPMNVDEINWDPQNLTGVGPYLLEIVRVSSRALKTIQFNRLKMNELQTKKLLRACKHLESLIFYRTNFSFPKIPDFTIALEQTTIRSLDLRYCEGPDYSNWLSVPEEFDNFINGLCHSDLSKSLAKISFGANCLLPGSLLAYIFRSYKFDLL